MLFSLLLLFLLLLLPVLFLSFSRSRSSSSSSSSSQSKYDPNKSISILLKHKNILTASATELARLIKAGKLTSSACVEAFIEQQVHCNEMINAVVANRYEAARQEAKQADEILQATEDKSQLPPFFGVPCSIKESFSLKGMPQTAGLVSRKGKAIATEDAPTVERLKAAGFIPLGVTNTSELCMWWESTNYLYGTTNNPYNIDRIVGGSSGGEGAIISACGAPCGLGADVGGSIRLPAFFNGIFGHKPSSGLVPNSGQFPLAQAGARPYLCTGPMCRHAEDLWPMLQVLQGPHPKDKFCRHTLMKSPDKVDLSKLQILTVFQYGPRFLVRGVDDEIRLCVEKAAAHLQSLGAKTRNREFAGLKENALGIWTSMMSKAGETPFQEQLADGGKPFNLAIEFGKWIAGKSVHTFPALGLCLLEKLTGLASSNTDACLRLGSRLRSQMYPELARENTILLTPTQPRVSPKHNAPLFSAFDFAYTGIYNVMELPVCQVPMGLNSAGLPTGLQVVAGTGNDALCIAVAVELEKQFGGWQPPLKRMRL